MDKETAVKTAVEWWRGLLAGDPLKGWDNNETPLAAALVSIGAPAGPSEHQLDRFAALLHDYLIEWIEPKAWDRDRPGYGAGLRIISTDHRHLHDIASEAGICTLFLPPKVHMELGPGGVRVGGYKQEWKKIPELAEAL